MNQLFIQTLFHILRFAILGSYCAGWFVTFAEMIANRRVLETSPSLAWASLVRNGKLRNMVALGSAMKGEVY